MNTGDSNKTTSSPADAAATRSGATPSAVLDAFLPPVVRVGQHELAPAALGHFIALERIDSPIVGDMEKACFEDAAIALYLLTLPAAEAMRQARDRDALDTAFCDFCARIPAEDLQEVAPRVAAQLNAAFATVVPSAPPSDGGSADAPFPKPPPAPPTASDGG